MSIFYCGFGGDFCGQSSTDDVNPGASIVILAFVNTNTDGSVTVDDVNFPTALVSAWQSKGKQVVISVGGQNGNWANVFASSTSIDNFVNSIQSIITKYNLDGVDLDIESYNAPPIVVANAIIQLKAAIGTKLVIVSPEDVAVYQGTTVPDENTGGQPFNYFVNIINRADAAIDYYQPQAYNNWYDGEVGGSIRYLQDVYENWRNLQGTGQWDTPLANFTGVKGSKLLIGVLASTSAGIGSYYASPTIIADFKNWIVANNH
jgi:chitinase